MPNETCKILSLYETKEAPIGMGVFDIAFEGNRAFVAYQHTTAGDVEFTERLEVDAAMIQENPNGFQAQGHFCKYFYKGMLKLPAPRDN